MKFSICSFAFHRGFFSGEIDALRYIQLSRDLGASHLHFWIVHLLRDLDLTDIRKWDWRPGSPEIPNWMRAPQDPAWVETLRQASAEAGLRHEMLAMEKGYAFGPDRTTRMRHRCFLEEWIAFAGAVGIPGVRVDPGGERDLCPEAVNAIVESYRELVAIGDSHKVRIFVENHWGASQQPEFLCRLLDEVEGLGLLLDSWNFGSDQERERGWELLAPRADAVHIKTRDVDAEGVEHMYPVDRCIARLCSADYKGIWGIESFPNDGADEVEAVRRTVTLIQRSTTAWAQRQRHSHSPISIT